MAVSRLQQASQRMSTQQAYCFGNVFVALCQDRSPQDDLMSLADLEQQFCDTDLHAEQVAVSP